MEHALELQGFQVCGSRSLGEEIGIVRVFDKVIYARCSGGPGQEQTLEQIVDSTSPI